MSEQAKTSVPKLRFPEFKHEDAWKQKKLKELFEIGSGKDYKHLSTGEIPVYGSGGYMLSVDDYLYDGESVCIGRKGTIDKPMLLNGKFWTVDTLFYTHSFKACSPRFIFSIFQNIDWLKHNEAGGVPSLSKTTINEITAYIPKPKEQQKIADCLSSLDDLITAQNQKVEALKQHKKGLMQQLFPAESETVPKLRFSEFKNDGEWVFSNADKIFQPISNKKHNSDLPILAITQEHGAIPREMIDYNVIATEQSIESYKVVEVGDFIISLRSFQGGIEYSNYKGICSPAYIILRNKINVFDLFFKYYFKTDLFIRELNKNIEGIRDGKMVSYAQFSELLLPFPNYDEQVKIGNCLLSIDASITFETNKLEAFKKHKKGLTQQLFPSLDEM